MDPVKGVGEKNGSLHGGGRTGFIFPSPLAVEGTNNHYLFHLKRNVETMTLHPPLPSRERVRGRGGRKPRRVIMTTRERRNSSVGRTRIAKALRSRMTDTEKLLWRHIRARRLANGKFKRQQPIGPYIVDFVSFKYRLVVEVDGGQHQDNETDRLRDAWLKARGYQVLRFWNNEVLTELPAVLERIAEFLSSPLSGEREFN